MRCPFCKKDDDKVIDSRSSSDRSVIRRRRECQSCNKRYTTYEEIEKSPLRVVKKGGEREPFDRSKVLHGLLKACEKRPVPTEMIEKTADEVEEEVNKLFEYEVNSTFIGEQIMKKLRKLDQVAYVRFASVYREFKDVSEFLSEIKELD